MTDIEQPELQARAEQREADLEARLNGSRRLAMPTDYVFDKAQEAFWDTKDGSMHSEKSVNASIPIEMWRVQVNERPEPAEGEGLRRGRPPGPARERLIPPSTDIMRVENDQFVEGATWWPGQELIIKDLFIDGNGWRNARGRRIYNKYLPPPNLEGDSALAMPWVDHVKRLWPAPAEHEFFFDYCAHMMQRPQEKCNAAIVLSGTQGIGKDAALHPVKAAIGTWNSKNIDPDQLFSAYKPWLETLMLVVDEVRPTKDEFHASSAYNILKPMIVTPPETLPMEEKYVKLRHIINRLRVFITTNDWLSMYIPPEDRRMFVMHSELQQRWNHDLGMPDYFGELFSWFEAGGNGHVRKWLLARNLSKFDPKAQVERTRGWEAVTASWGEPEDCVSLALEQMGHPDVVFGQELANGQFDGAEELAGMLKSPRKIGHRMNKSGYAQCPPPEGSRWHFSFEGKKLAARYAFVKNGAAANAQEAAALVRAKGRLLVEKKG